MKTFRKYEKTYRIEMSNISVRGKFMLKKSDEKKLLGGNVAVFEKVDGAGTGIFKKNGQIFLQKRRGNIDYSHYQYKFFKRWAYENIEKVKKLPDNTVTYGELMICVHSIYYDRLPDLFLVFDIYDLKEERFLKWCEVAKICENVGLKTVPLIYEGKINKDILNKLIPKKSAYGEIAEGVVVKNYRQQIRGKIVKAQFIKTIEDDGRWENKKIRLNKVI